MISFLLSREVNSFTEHACVHYYYLLLIFIAFMQGIYDYIPETNHISRAYSVAALFCLQFMVHVIVVPLLNALYFYISAFRSTCAVPNMSDFCSS